MYANARSLYQKIELLHTYLEVENIDLAALSETWFHDDILRAETHISGYQCFRKDRIDKRGGGVVLYVK